MPSDDETLRRIEEELRASDPELARLLAHPTSPAPRGASPLSWYRRLEARAAERWARRRGEI